VINGENGDCENVDLTCAGCENVKQRDVDTG